MEELFPYSNILGGVLVLIVGFGIHWLNRVALYLHWEFMPRHGFGIIFGDSQNNYNRWITISDMTIGWLYGVIGVGLILGMDWGYDLAWIPGVILTLEGISYWINNGKKKSDPAQYTYFTPSEWKVLNLLTGLFVIIIAWNAL